MTEPPVKLSQAEMASMLHTIRQARDELERRRFVIACYSVMLGYLAAVAQGVIGVILVAVAIGCVEGAARLWTKMRRTW